MVAMVLLLVLLVACTRLVVPEKGIFVPGKGKMMAMAALALSMAMPAEGTQYFAWWRLREADGKIWYVWPEGYWEELPVEYAEAVENLFQTEPEMAVYVIGMSQSVGAVPEWPPTWHIPSNMWVMSREEPEPRLHWVAQPENLDLHALSPLSSHPFAGETRNTCPGNFQPRPGREPSSARYGDQHVSSDGSTTTVWRDHHTSSGVSSGSSGPSRPAEGYRGPGEGHHTPWGWQEPGQGSTKEPEQGYWQWCTPNPDRYWFRGKGSQDRRELKRHLERTGQPVPEHLKPQAQVLNKAAKQQMFLLHQRAREMATAQSQEEIDAIAEKFLALQQEESKKLESLKKAKGDNASHKKEDGAGDGGTVPPRKPYVGKHRSPSVPAKGTPPQAKDTGTIGGANGTDDDAEEDDEVPDYGDDDDRPKEGKKKKQKKKKKSKSRSRAKKEEDPPDKKDPGDPQDPKGPKDPPPSTSAATVA